MTLSDQDFAKLIKQTKLNLDGEEVAKIRGQIDEALKAIKVFDELNLKNVAPLEHPGGLDNVMREDVIKPSFTQEEALQNAPGQHDGYVMVPGVFEEQS